MVRHFLCLLILSGALMTPHARTDDDVAIEGEIREFHDAIRSDNIDEVRRLIHHAGVRTATLHEHTALQVACMGGHGRIVSLLLDEADAEVDHVDKDKWTAFMYAAFHGCTDCARALASAGAAVDMTNEYGMTALKLAAAKNHRDIVKILLDAGADKGAKDMYGHTAKHYAEKNKHHDLARELLHDEL